MNNLGIREKKWMDNYNILMLFCTTKQRFPKSDDTINGLKIGNWFMNQRKLYKQNTLDVKRIALLDKISPLWRGSPADLRLFKHEILADKIVEYAIDRNHVPITEMVGITKKELNSLISRKLITCELLVLSNNVSMDTKYRALAAMYKDDITINYFKLLNELKNYKSYEELKREVVIKDIKTNIDDALDTLDEDGKEIITLYYGLKEGNEMALRDVGNVIGLSHERVRQILNKSMQTLRSPYIFNMIICRGSELYDEIKTIGDSGKNNLKTQVTYKNRVENRAIYRYEEELTVGIVNALMSNGYNTLGDVIRISKNNLTNIPNLGNKNASLLREFIGKYEKLSQ